MAGLRKIDNVMYRVKDLDEAARFYEGVLGLKRVWMDEDAGQIGFVFPESDAEIVIHTDFGIPNPDFSFLVDDVVAFCENYERQGYRVARKPFDVRCGKFAVLEDPDGNPIPIVDLTRVNQPG
jgi:catechol 2,3-dioxygenase-like lactoylglutathione lyase family enzyme